MTEAQLTASSQRGNLLACKTEKSKLDVVISRFSEICHHKAGSTNNLFILSFCPIICVLSVCGSFCHLLSVCLSSSFFYIYHLSSPHVQADGRCIKGMTDHRPFPHPPALFIHAPTFSSFTYTDTLYSSRIDFPAAHNTENDS